MYTIGIIAGILSSVLEIRFVSQIGFVKKLYTDGLKIPFTDEHIPGGIFDMLGSFLLSSLIVGGPGTVVGMIAGITGVATSSLYWKIWPWFEANDFTPARAQRELKAHETEIREAAAKTWQTTQDLIAVIRSIIRFITWPVRKKRELSQKYTALKARIRPA